MVRAFLASVILLPTQVVLSPAQTPSGPQVKADIEFLAADRLEGQEPARGIRAQPVGRVAEEDHQVRLLGAGLRHAVDREAHVLTRHASHPRARERGFHLDPVQAHRALYVTRGIGHLLKVRFFCPPEITVITLSR